MIKNFLRNITFFKLAKFILFMLIFLIPVYVMNYLDEALPIGVHELWLPYGRSFFHPEHGRYFATAVESITLEHIPLIFNIHPFDLRTTLISYIMNFLSVCIFSIIAGSFFLFNVNKSKTNLWVWLFCYIVTFFILFSDNYNYFYHIDFTSFLEYAVSLVPYFVAVAISLLLFTKYNPPSKLIGILFAVSSFFTGLTLELINIPFFIYLGIMTHILIFDYLKSDRTVEKKQLLNTFVTAMFYNALSCVVYYSQPVDHPIVDKYILFSSSLNFFVEVSKKVVIDFLPLYVLLLVAVFAILIFRKNTQTQNVKIIASSMLNLFTVLLFFYLGFFYITFNYDVLGLLEDKKYFFIIPAILLFQNFILWGYFVAGAKNNRNRLSLAIILAILLANYTYIDGYIDKIKNRKMLSYEKRERYYRFEQHMLSQAGQETIYFPGLHVVETDFLDRVLIYCLRILHYPDFKNFRTMVVDDSTTFDEVFKNEKIKSNEGIKKDLKYSDNLKHKIMKFEDNYLFYFEKVKTDGTKTYYELKEY